MPGPVGATVLVGTALHIALFRVSFFSRRKVQGRGWRASCESKLRLQLRVSITSSVHSHYQALCLDWGKPVSRCRPPVPEGSGIVGCVSSPLVAEECDVHQSCMPPGFLCRGVMQLLHVLGIPITDATQPFLLSTYRRGVRASWTASALRLLYI